MKKNGMALRWIKRFEMTPARRWLLGAGAGLALLAGFAGLVGFSVWVEDRFPADDPGRSLVPGLQRILTRPIVDAVSRHVERYVRRKLEAPYMNIGGSAEGVIARILDESLDMKERMRYAYRLAREGTPPAIAALAAVFQKAQPEDRVFMARLIGTTRNPPAKDVLWPLLDDADLSVRLAALRGLAAIGGADVSNKLGALLDDPRQPEEVRIGAAHGLADMGTPADRDLLVRALAREEATDVGTEILNSLGRFPFPTVVETFEKILSDPEAPEFLRVAAVEALAHSSKEAVPFLLTLTENDRDPDVRASAAWALSLQGPQAPLGPVLYALAEKEDDPDVRRRLYEAMLPQTGIPPERLAERVLAEDDVDARVAGFNALGSAVGRNPASAAAAPFDRQIVPELLQIATSENSLNIRMRAVFALRRARTSAAQAALGEIAATPTPQIAEAARHGLQVPK
jgi:HEAT repeat protein